VRGNGIVPFAAPHGKGVNVLVELVEERNALDDHVVRPVHVELDLGAGVGVRETELGPLNVTVAKVGDERAEVAADGTENLRGNLGLGLG
jgi:hypothetical protein